MKTTGPPEYQRKPFKFALLIILLALTPIAIPVVHIALARRHAAHGRLADALIHYHAAINNALPCSALPGGALAAEFEQATEQLLSAPPNELPLQTELILVRWLAETQPPERLAAFLDTRRVHIPAGEFTLGDPKGRPDEQPVRLIELDGFTIARYETTHAQYRRFLLASGATPPRYWSGTEYPAGLAAHPVVGVSWEQAQAYCAWAGGRLPTEAEWENTCRGSYGQRYPWGERWDARRANTGLHSSSAWPASPDEAWNWLARPDDYPQAPALQPVGSYPAGASPYGVLDLCGSAAEWVQDAYNWGGYAGLPARNPLNTTPPWNHVIRGAAWFDLSGHAAETPQNARCAARSSSHSYDDPRVGFRCVFGHSLTAKAVTTNDAHTRSSSHALVEAHARCSNFSCFPPTAKAITTSHDPYALVVSDAR